MEMRRFDLDLLNTLVAVAEEKSLSAAALRLARSQSAISEQIRKLEEFCGLPLLVRGKQGARLTPAGDRLMIHARKLLLLSDVARQDMQGALMTGDLRLAVTDYFRPAAIAGVLRRIREQYPRLRLHVSVRKSAQIEQDADGGDFDVGISLRILKQDARTRGGSPDRTTALRREPLAWVAAPSFVFDPEAAVPLVALPESCSLHRFAVRQLEMAGAPFYIAHSASGIGGLQSALCAGLGVACLNASAIPAAASIVGARGVKFPTLPDVEFNLVVASGFVESEMASDIEKMLTEQFA
jgi:DNA-binding transcriptional LysR family regulator